MGIKYTGEWYSYPDDVLKVNIMRYKLRVEGIDASTWTLDGLQGYWLGMGIGAYTMAGGADMTFCLYSHVSWEEPNELDCTDAKGIIQSRPKPDTR